MGAVRRLFAFLAFECLLLAVVMKGEWWILLVPSIVCSIKARETWVRLREIVGPRDSGRDPTTSA